MCCDLRKWNSISTYKGHIRHERASGDFQLQQMTRWEMTDTNTDILLRVLPSLASLESEVMMNWGEKKTLVAQFFFFFFYFSTCDMSCLRSHQTYFFFPQTSTACNYKTTKWLLQNASPCRKNEINCCFTMQYLFACCEKIAFSLRYGAFWAAC